MRPLLIPKLHRVLGSVFCRKPELMDEFSTASSKDVWGWIWEGMEQLDKKLMNHGSV